MHEVYSFHNVLGVDVAQLKIESLDCWENNLYIGTADGHLLHYCVELGEHGTYRSELVTKRQLAAKKAVYMLKVLLPVQRIVAGIDGSDITVLSLTTLQDVEVMPNTKGCKAFCTNSESSLGSVCVVVKRKLMLFDHVGCFVLAKEFMLPDTPDVIHWRGNFIATAYKRSYCVMSSLDGSVEDLNVEFDPRVTRPFISFLKSDELIVVKESLGVVLDCTGMPTRSSLNLSDSAPHGQPVSVLAASLLEPFVIVLQGNGICVFGLDNDVTLQQIEVKSALGMCESGDRIYVFGKEGVSMLLPVPPVLQVKQLLAQGDVHAALRVHSVMPGSDDAVVHAEAASVFFKQLQFVNATKHWIQAGTDPRSVLLLFPDIVNRLPPACFSGIKNGIGGSVADIVRSGVAARQQQQLPQSIRNSRDIKKQEPASLELDQLELDLYVQEAISAVSQFVLSSRSLLQWKSLLPTLDSALAILLVLSTDERQSLGILLAQPHHIVVEWVETFLEEHEHLLELGQLFKGGHQPARALAAWQRMQIRCDSRSAAAAHVSETIQLLLQCNSADLVREHALWVMCVSDEAANRLFSTLPLSVIQPIEVLKLLPANQDQSRRLQRLLLGIYVEHRQLKDEFLETSLGCILAESAVACLDHDRILPVADVTLEPRRKTLLWLDDNPDSPENVRIRRGIPGHGSSKPVEGLGEGRLYLAPDNTDIALEDQVDVTLFTSVDGIDAFLCDPSQHKFVKYPSSLFRIVSNRRLFVGASGLWARIRSNPTWQSAFPSIMVFHGQCDDGLDALKGHSNLKITQIAGDCLTFASFQSAQVAATKSMDRTVTTPSQASGEMNSSPRFAFRQFLQRYCSYNVEQLMDKVSFQKSPIAVCLLYRAQNRHEEALQMLSSELSSESISLCEDYCNGGPTFAMQRDDKTFTAPSKLLLLFVQMMYKDTDASLTSQIEIRRSVAMEIMQRNGNVLDFLEVLPVLPPSLPLNQVAPIIFSSMQQLLHASRSYQILRSLAKVDNVVTKCQLLSARESHIRVTKDLSCAKCSKRIGDAAFVVPPGQPQLAYHLNCYDSSS